MGDVLYKLFICIVVVIVSFVINYFLLKKDKKKLKIVLIIIFVVQIIHFVLDYMLFKTNMVDYIASQLLISFLFSIVFEDVYTYNIDIRVVLVYTILFAVYRVIFIDLDIILEGVKGFILCLVSLLIPFIFKKKLIGFGDVLAVSACGLIIGYPGVYNFLFKTFLLVFIFGLYLLISKRKNVFSEIPLAPFLLLATII